MNRREGPPDPDAFAPQVVFDYHRTLVGYHGTSRQTADHLVDGGPFTASTNDDDWLGHGIYFWEYAPLQAWAWAERRYGTHAAVVGAMIRLGRCLDLLDPQNLSYVDAAHQKLQALGRALPNNANTHKFLDCVVFNYLYDQFGDLATILNHAVPFMWSWLPENWNVSGLAAASFETAISSCAYESRGTF
jgi:hypothetical protein